MLEKMFDLLNGLDTFIVTVIVGAIIIAVMIYSPGKKEDGQDFTAKPAVEQENHQEYYESIISMYNAMNDGVDMEP